MTRQKDRLYVIQKYVWAKDSKEALRKEKLQHADDVYIDANWKNAYLHTEKDAPIGFTSNKKATR